MDLFATDTSRWVKSALHQSLGEVAARQQQRVSSSACDAPLGDPLLAVQVIYNCGPKVAPSVISYFLSLASNSGFAGRFPCTNGTKKFVLQICPTTAAVFASFI